MVEKRARARGAATKAGPSPTGDLARDRMAAGYEAMLEEVRKEREGWRERAEAEARKVANLREGNARLEGQQAVQREENARLTVWLQEAREELAGARRELGVTRDNLNRALGYIDACDDARAHPSLHGPRLADVRPLRRTTVGDYRGSADGQP